jgi:hypothetical protein
MKISPTPLGQIQQTFNCVGEVIMNLFDFLNEAPSVAQEAEQIIQQRDLYQRVLIQIALQHGGKLTVTPIKSIDDIRGYSLLISGEGIEAVWEA